MKLLTVYTPSYNREEYLPAVYESLKKQTNKDFVWLIVDDGSTDGTSALIDGYINEGIVDIRYIKKENGGKHTATNTALDVADTELIMIALDSDDSLTDGAVEKIVRAYKENGDGVYGYVFMKQDKKGKKLYNTYSADIGNASLKDAVSKGLFDGEALFVFRTSYINQYRYPVIDGEKFFTEAYVYLQLDKPLYWSREVIYIAEYLEDGYSKNIVESFVHNPVCYMMYNNLRSGIFTSLLLRLKFFAYYDGFAMLSKTKGFIKKSAKPVTAALMLPFGFAFYLYLGINCSRMK